ncbi:MAG: hypothetical protein MI743_00605, partial [Sneathiellales bacterium]|nr:hypothetical protein [Sneathiellales bacterium]
TIGGVSILLSLRHIFRIVNIKSKRIEIEKFKNQLKSAKNEKEKLQKEITNINADISANQAKNEELKKHIDLINLQIHDNKLKLEESFI